MNLEKARREAEAIARYADRIEKSDPTGHVAAMGYAARHILVLLQEDEQRCVPERSSMTRASATMTFTVLEKNSK